MRRLLLQSDIGSIPNLNYELLTENYNEEWGIIPDSAKLQNLRTDLADDTTLINFVNKISRRGAYNYACYCPYWIIIQKNVVIGSYSPLFFMYYDGVKKLVASKNFPYQSLWQKDQAQGGVNDAIITTRNGLSYMRMSDNVQDAEFLISNHPIYNYEEVTFEQIYKPIIAIDTKLIVTDDYKYVFYDQVQNIEYVSKSPVLYRYDRRIVVTDETLMNGQPLDTTGLTKCAFAIVDDNGRSSEKNYYFDANISHNWSDCVANHAVHKTDWNYTRNKFYIRKWE